jgi:hypothetical protein
MLEDHLYWVLVYWRWMKDDNFARGPKGFFKRAPALIRPLVERMVRAKVRRNLHGHGIGRHSEAEMTPYLTTQSKPCRRSSATTSI